MNSLVPTSKEHSKTDWTWTNILSSFCWTNLKKAIRSVIHSRNKHGMILIKKKKKKQAWNDMLMLFNGKFGSKYEKSYGLSTWLLVFIFTVFSYVQLLM